VILKPELAEHRVEAIAPLAVVGGGVVEDDGDVVADVLGNSGKLVTLETLSLTKFSKHVFQEQGIRDCRNHGTCEAKNSRMCKVRES
jgi:hypothetical protein